MNINNLNKRLINLYLKEINYGNKSITKGRPDKEELNHYIDVIFKVIKTGIPWRALNEKYNFSTYHKKFVKWNNLNLFENIHKIIIKLLNSRNLLFNNSKDLYIGAVSKFSFNKTINKYFKKFIKYSIKIINLFFIITCFYKFIYFYNK